MFNIICLDFNLPSSYLFCFYISPHTHTHLVRPILYLICSHCFIFKFSGFFLSSFCFALSPNWCSLQLTHSIFQLWKFLLSLFCVFRFSLCQFVLPSVLLSSSSSCFNASICKFCCIYHLRVWFSGLMFLLGYGVMLDINHSRLYHQWLGLQLSPRGQFDLPTFGF